MKIGQEATSRWGPCLAMTAVSLISYVDRSVLSVLSPTILRELGLTATQYGFALSVFSIVYAISNPIWGYAMDRLGLSLCIIAAVSIWSAGSGLHAFVSGIAGLCFARGVLALGEGATFPAGLSAVTRYLPPEKQSLGVALSYSGGSLGAVLTPVFAIPLAARLGWRAVFFVTCLMGAIWILGWTILDARTPSSKTRTRFWKIESLRSMLHAKTQPSETYLLSSLARGWVSHLRKLNTGKLADLVATVSAYGLGAMPLAFGLYAAPLYLSKVLHESQAALGSLLWIPPLGWEVGYLFWGTVRDRWEREMSQRSTLLFLLLGFLSTSVMFISFVSTLWQVMALFFISMFSAGGYVVLSLAYGIKTQGKESAGSVAGSCVAVWSVAVAFMMPVIGRLFDRGSYFTACLLTGFLPLLGTALWLGLSLRTSDKAQAPPTLHNNPMEDRATTIAERR